MNPNNCTTCDHKKEAFYGHCYMFRDRPQEVCMKHTERDKAPKLMRQLLARVDFNKKYKTKENK